MCDNCHSVCGTLCVRHDQRRWPWGGECLMKLMPVRHLWWPWLLHWFSHSWMNCVLDQLWYGLHLSLVEILSQSWYVAVDVSAWLCRCWFIAFDGWLSKLVLRRFLDPSWLCCMHREQRPLRERTPSMVWAINGSALWWGELLGVGGGMTMMTSVKRDKALPYVTRRKIQISW